jgi:serine/threonine protein phosphatase 1
MSFGAVLRRRGDAGDRGEPDTLGMPDERLPRVPDDWRVWAFSDPHGVTSAFVTALQAAELIDHERRWMAPPRTALVGCGDYIDRGGDIRGMVELLRHLQTAAAAAGSVVHLARGNHEAMPLMVRTGATEWLDTWLYYGGEQTVEAYDCDPDALIDPERTTETMEACSPGLFDWMAAMPQAVRWRDVLFVHGGLAPGHALDDLGVTTEEHLWVRSGFFEQPWDDGDFAAYQRDGIDRVVFGHTPQPDGPMYFHDGHSLDIDTNAVGNPRMPAGAHQSLTLLGFEGDGSFEQARFVSIPTDDAPDTMAR